MTASKNIIDVGDSDFQYEVIAYSNQSPVVVDFWAEWCGPCKVLSPTLEKLASESDGGFRLAKVDVDANPNLTMQYKVQSIPSVKAFRDGLIVAEFTGARGEAQVRDFLRSLAPGPGQLAMEKAHSLLSGGDWEKAAHVFGQVLNTQPDDASALLGLAKSHLAQGESRKALPILRGFPASKEFIAAEQLLPLAEALLAMKEDDEIANDELAPAFQRSLKLVSLGNIEAAIDGLLDILRTDKNYRKGEVPKIIIGLILLLGEDNPQSRDYRSELSSLLF